MDYSAWPANQFAPNVQRYPMMAVRASTSNPVAKIPEIAALLKEKFSAQQEAMRKSLKPKYIYGVAVISGAGLWEDVDKSALDESEVQFIEAYIAANKESRIEDAKKKKKKDVKQPVFWVYNVKQFIKLASPFEYTGVAARGITALNLEDTVKLLRDENTGIELLDTGKRLCCGAVDPAVIVLFMEEMKTMEVRAQRLRILDPSVDVEFVCNICARIVIYI